VFGFGLCALLGWKSSTGISACESQKQVV